MTGTRDHGPFVVALAASLALHGAALAAVLWGWNPSPPTPIATRTIALVVVGGPPRDEAAAPPAAKPTPKTAPATAPATRSPAPTPTLVADRRAPPPKPVTPDPRKQTVPVFKPPPRRPAPPAETTRAPAHDATPAPIKPTQASKATAPPAQSTPSADRQLAVLPAGAAAGAAQPQSPPHYGKAGLANPRPRYPWLSRQRGEQGRVVVRVAVDARGGVTTVTVTESSGHGRLDRAALRALRRWHFEPAHRAGRAVPGTVDVPITFRLDDEG